MYWTKFQLTPILKNRLESKYQNKLSSYLTTNHKLIVIGEYKQNTPNSYVYFKPNPRN